MGRARDPLFDEGRRKHPFIGFLIMLLILIIVTVATLNTINNSRVNLIRQSVTIPTLPSALENFRILHISDLHGLYFGLHQEQIQAALASARYDVVCVTGDVTDPNGDVSAFLALIDLLRDKAPVYFITGDEDPSPILSAPHGGKSAKADYILQAEARGAVYLDTPVKITRGKGALWLSPEWIYQMDDAASEAAYQARLTELQSEAASPERDAALAAIEYQIDQLNRIREAQREILETDAHIALIHHPLSDTARKELRDWTQTDNGRHITSVALVLAGHYVGGQWRIPGIGAVRAPIFSETGDSQWFPEDGKIMGLSTVNGIPQYISPGLGTSAASGLPPIRLFNTPAVTVITLTSKLTQ
ncbi:MAG: metallophosphoesterase [Clostridia bacterium]|nr:metallophosphoesterase [Clostridia bacterium]